MHQLQTTAYNYDPARSGYDTNQWKTLLGTPTIITGYIQLNDAAILSYGDFWRGRYMFHMNLPTDPTANCNRIWGLYNVGTGNHATFVIGVGTMYVETSNIGEDDVANVTTVPVVYDSTWTGVDTNFQIRIEAGTAKFFVNKTQIAAITDDSVPTGAMSPYAFDFSATPMWIKDLHIDSLQSFYMNPVSADVSGDTGSNVYMFDGSKATENVKMKIPTLTPGWTGTITDTSSVTDAPVVTIPTLGKISLNDTSTVTAVVSSIVEA